MAKTAFAKTIYCLAGGGLIAGCLYATKSYLIGDRAIDLIRENDKDKQLLSRSSSVDKWKKAWFNYRSANKEKGTNVWNLSDYDPNALISDNDLAPASFIEACESNSSGRVKGVNDTLYEEIIKWCTGGSKVKDLVRDSGKRTLTDKEFDKEGWKTLLKDYVTSHKNQNPLGIDLSSIPAEKPENSEELLKRFKGKCQELSDIEVTGTTDSNYEKVDNYCSAKIKAEDLIRDSFSNKKRLIDLTKTKEADFNQSSAPQAIWNRYKNNTKDPWNVIPTSGDKENIPAGFFDKCKDRRKVEAKDTESEAFKEVLNFCTVDKSEFEKYGEKY